MSGRDGQGGSEVAGDGGVPDELRKTVVIGNRLGLHARAAAKFVKTVGRFDAEVFVVRNGTMVSGASILGLMMLGAGPGAEIELRATGEQATEAIEALRHLVGDGFDED